MKPKVTESDVCLDHAEVTECEPAQEKKKSTKKANKTERKADSSNMKLKVTESDVCLDHAEVTECNPAQHDVGVQPTKSPAVPHDILACTPAAEELDMWETVKQSFLGSQEPSMGWSVVSSASACVETKRRRRRRTSSTCASETDAYQLRSDVEQDTGTAESPRDLNVEAIDVPLQPLSIDGVYEWHGNKKDWSKNSCSKYPRHQMQHAAAHEEVKPLLRNSMAACEVDAHETPGWMSSRVLAEKSPVESHSGYNVDSTDSYILPPAACNTSAQTDLLHSDAFSESEQDQTNIESWLIGDYMLEESVEVDAHEMLHWMSSQVLADKSTLESYSGYNVETTDSFIWPHAGVQTDLLHSDAFVESDQYQTNIASWLIGDYMLEESVEMSAHETLHWMSSRVLEEKSIVESHSGYNVDATDSCVWPLAACNTGDQTDLLHSDSFSESEQDQTNIESWLIGDHMFEESEEPPVPSSVMSPVPRAGCKFSDNSPAKDQIPWKIDVKQLITIGSAMALESTGGKEEKSPRSASPSRTISPLTPTESQPSLSSVRHSLPPAPSFLPPPVPSSPPTPRSSSPAPLWRVPDAAPSAITAIAAAHTPVKGRADYPGWLSSNQDISKKKGLGIFSSDEDDDDSEPSTVHCQGSCCHAPELVPFPQDGAGLNDWFCMSRGFGPSLIACRPAH
jgi:hypothetical protein